MRLLRSVFVALIVVLAVFAHAGKAEAAVAINDAWSMISTSAPANATGTVTITNQSVAGTTADKRIYLVYVGLELSGANTLTNLSVTYGGKALVPIASTAARSAAVHSYVGYLTDTTPNNFTSPGSVVVSYTAAGGTVTGLTVRAASYKGVNQASPISGFGYNSVAAVANVPFHYQATTISYVTDGLSFIVADCNSGTLRALTSSPAAFPASPDEALNSAFQVGGMYTVNHTGNGSFSNTDTITWSGGTSTSLVVVSLAPVPACTDSDPSTITIGAGQTASGNPYDASALKTSTGDVGSFEYSVTKSAPATITNPQGWTVVYTGQNSPGNQTYTVNAGSNRMLVVGVGTGLSGTTATQTCTATFDGNALTKAITDETTNARQHTWLFYLQDTPASMDGTAKTLNIACTNGGQTLRTVSVHAAVFAGVDQTGTPLRDAKNYNSGGTTTGAPVFASALAANAGDQPVVFGNSYRTGSTTTRTITAATNWTRVTHQSTTNTDAMRTSGLNRTISATNTTDTAPFTITGGNTLASMSGMSLKPGIAITTCTNWQSSSSLPATTAGGSLCGDYADGGTYLLNVRGIDPDCGALITSTPANFTWNSCAETATVDVTNPGVVAGPTAITVTLGGSGGSNPQWSANGGTNWYNSGAIYTPPTCASGAVTFIGRATGSCAGTITDPTPVVGSYNTTDADLATLTVTGPASPVSGIKTVAVQVGVESAPATLSAVVVNIANAGACNVSNGFMTWNGGTSRWEYSWDTSACGTGAVVGGVTIIASATDPDCSNNVTSPTATVSIDNTCVPAAGTVSWTPPGGTVSTPIVVTATVTGSANSPEVSFDDGATWLANGSTYTPRVDGQGTLNFQVRAFNNCGIRIYGGPYAVTYDGRLPRIRPLSIAADAFGKTTIRVLMEYCSDKNNNAQTTLRYKLTSDPDLPGNWTTVGPFIDGQAGDADGLLNQNVLFMLTGLTTDTSYDLQLTVADTDGVDWTTIGGAQPWTATVALTSWIDSNVMHNALRFACSKIGYSDETSCLANGGIWNLDNKWPGGWGLPVAQYPGAQYDSFECGTCHVKNSSNVKRVITAVVPKADGPFPGSTVNLQDVREGTAQFGDDSGGHTSSTRVCEACHSKTTYHRQDTTGQTNLQHNNKTDCIRCHEHNVGFRASCDSCHGTPPVSVGGLVTTDPTGSTVWGEHQKHAVDIGYDCKTCHNGWDGANQMPNSGNLNIGFKASINPQFNGAVEAVDGGTYEGRTTGGGYAGDTTTTPATTVNTATGTMTCANYCHGYGRPVWNPASIQPCGSCHGKVGSGVGYQSGAPTGVSASKDLSGATTGYKVGKHANHLDDSVFQTGDPCKLCHDGFGYADATHVNGTVNVKLRQAAKLTSPGTTGGAGLTAVYTPGVPGVSPGTCATVCHGATPWDSAAVLNCTQSCHNYPPVGVTAGYSTYAGGFVTPVTHVTPNGTQYLKDNHGQCKYCHGWNDNGSGALPISGMTAAELTAMNGDPGEAVHFVSIADDPVNGYHMDSNKITMNSDNDANGANDADYDPTTGGCNTAVCHGNDAAHQFTAVGTGSGNVIQPADIGPGDCGACHTTGVGGATVVTPSSPHTKVTKNGTFTGCGSCHGGHYTSPGGVQIPNNAAVGINYAGAQHGGIKLGGPTTHASINTKTTEAEICWGCHDAMGTASVKKATITFTATTIVASDSGLNVFTVNKPLKVAGSSVGANNKWVTPTAVAAGTLTFPAGTFTADATAGEMISLQDFVSEWGMNTKQTGTSPVPTQYDLGMLSTSNWTTATWSSGKTSFAYKTGAIQSTHAANAAGTSAVSGAIYAKTETKDNVANLRCSYCHDVHDAVGPNGPPYLRGTWWSNPYEEDGAPQSGQAYVNMTEYGAVPRGGTTAANQQKRLGGFWIDANNVRPNTALTTADGVLYANPTATGGTGTGGAWTLADSAGLCVMCHGNNVNTMDQTTGEALWFGTNGHANSVIGGTGTASTYAANIFELRGGTANNNASPAMHFKGASEPGDSGGFGYRNGGNSQYNYTPSINTVSENTLPYAIELWGAALSYDNTTTNSQYHKFSCSKCHNPHASRLPKLMITNCLDTKHNTWDDTYQLNGQAGVNLNTSLSNWSSAQNCHRMGGIIPANRIIPATGGTYPEPVDAGAVAPPAGTGTDYQNRGWNVVTPW